MKVNRAEFQLIKILTDIISNSTSVRILKSNNLWICYFVILHYSPSYISERATNVSVHLFLLGISEQISTEIFVNNLFPVEGNVILTQRTWNSATSDLLETHLFLKSPVGSKVHV